MYWSKDTTVQVLTRSQPYGCSAFKSLSADMVYGVRYSLWQD